MWLSVFLGNTTGAGDGKETTLLPGMPGIIAGSGHPEEVFRGDYNMLWRCLKPVVVVSGQMRE